MARIQPIWDPMLRCFHGKFALQNLERWVGVPSIRCGLTNQVASLEAGVSWTNFGVTQHAGQRSKLRFTVVLDCKQNFHPHVKRPCGCLNQFQSIVFFCKAGSVNPKPSIQTSSRTFHETCSALRYLHVFVLHSSGMCDLPNGSSFVPIAKCSRRNV